MELLITGGRHLQPKHYEALSQWLDRQQWRIEGIWHGGAIGGDRLADRYAAERAITRVVIKPNYREGGGKIAPLIRNAELVAGTTHTLALHDGEMSNGTAHTTKLSIKKGHPTWALNVSDGSATKLR